MALALGAAPAQADSATAIQQLIDAGNLPQALTQVDGLIASNPKDPQYRFLRGVILTKQHKTAEAINVFTQLTQQYPELPEPYNNLAVLYAQRGQYDMARNALEMAIRTNPSYATAYENLGDIYAKLASVAYEKALRLTDNKSDAVQAKLALLDRLLAQPSPPEAAAASAAQAAPSPPRAEASAPASGASAAGQ